MRFWPSLFAWALAMALAFGSTAAADDATAIARLAETDVKHWIGHPTIVDAIRAQNDRHQHVSPDEIAALDRIWRSETASVSKPMIQALMANALSSFLMQKKQAGKGLYTEIFAMDAHGLNVGQSDPTSDYWQGDEDKWRKTFLAGPNSMHIGDAERDGSTRVLRRQLSLPVADPVSGKVIGAITVGIDVSRLTAQ